MICFVEIMNDWSPTRVLDTCMKDINHLFWTVTPSRNTEEAKVFEVFRKVKQNCRFQEVHLLFKIITIAKCALMTDQAIFRFTVRMTVWVFFCSQLSVFPPPHPAAIPAFTEQWMWALDS